MGDRERVREIVEGVAIEGMSSEGRGFAHINGKIVFADFAAPGDVADIEIRKNN